MRLVNLTLCTLLACGPVPPDGVTSEVPGSESSSTAIPTTEAESTGRGSSSTSESCPEDACTRCDSLAAECVQTPGCDVRAVLEACGQIEIHCGCPESTSTGEPAESTSGSTGEVCIGETPPPGEPFGRCKGTDHKCGPGMICQIADDPDPQFPKGTMCLPTCWGEGNEGNEGTCPEALDSCGEPFAKTACQAATAPGREVPCLLPCSTDDDCGIEGLRCWLDRCVWEGL